MIFLQLIMASHIIRWQNFPADRNLFISQGADFSDVTLACDDDHQLSAHRIILSAGSLFLRKILSQVKHPHPFVYLSGVGKSELDRIVEFLYTGETLVTESDLEKFLKSSKLLQIIGVENDDVSNNINIDSDTEPLTEYKNYVETETKGDEDENLSVFNDGQSEDLFDIKPNLDFDAPETLEADLMKEEESKKSSSDQSDAWIEKVDGLWECKVCGKAFVRKNHSTSHIQIHMDDISLPCKICGKISRTKAALRMHEKNAHSEETFVCTFCGKSGMNRMRFKSHKWQSKCKEKFKE